MRLNRGSGLAGLAGVRAAGLVPGTTLPLLRPLLGFRRGELARLVAANGLQAAHDPSNADPRFDRVRIRQALAHAPWLDPAAIAASAAHLEEAAQALDWAAEREWNERVDQRDGALRYRPLAPRAIRLAVIGRAIAQLGQTPRGGDVARLLDQLEAGGGGNVAGVLARDTMDGWLFSAEPPRASSKPSSSRA